MKLKVLNSQKLNDVKEVNLVLATNNIQEECLIGRSPASGLVLESPDVSRLHGKFFLQKGNYYFCDLGSRNGSIVNGNLAQTNQSYLLKAGDVVRIGEFVLIMEEINAVPEDLPATVFGGVDATVISGWRSLAVEPAAEISSSAKPEKVPDAISLAAEAIIAPEESLQSPEPVSEVAEIETPASVEIGQAFFAAITAQDLSKIQSVEEANVEGDTQIPDVVSKVSESTFIQSEVVLGEPTFIQIEEAIAPPTETVKSESETTFIQSEEIEAVAAATTFIQTPAPENSCVLEEEAAIFETSTPVIVNEFPAVSDQISEEVTEETEGQSVETLEAAEIIDEMMQPDKMNEISGEIIPQEINAIEVLEIELLELDVEVADLMTQAPKEIGEASEAPENDDSVTLSLAEENITESEVLALDTELGNETSQPVTTFSTVTDVTTTPNLAGEVTAAPELSIQPVEEEEAIFEAVDRVPDTMGDVPKITSQKYIALMAHESMKSNLVQFVSKHQEFFSQCLTIATPAMSETLHQLTGVAVSQQTPTVPAGGYQAIASLVGSEDILAVIFLRDCLQTQPGQANEEALLRLCNINQILFATNVPTAEAIVHYIRNLVTS